jgi:tRNA(Ile)-lysidine synthase
MVEKVFENTLGKHGLLKKKDKIILGVSGGPDSVFMLYQFDRIKKDYKLNLTCAHFNHSLRKEADSEEDFIKEVCGNLGIKFISEKKDVKAFFKGDSLEQTARDLRLDFLLKCCRQIKVKKIALAHHKDDLIETVLMRVIKGSGLRGLRGFLPKTKFRSATIIRPLIEMRKKDILNWLKKHKISYCIDKSNFEEKFLRNRIRLKLLPALLELNPNIVDNLSNLASNISLDYDFIYSVSFGEFLSLKRTETRNSLNLDLEGLKKLPLAIFNNVLRAAIEGLKGNTRKLERRHLDEVRDLVLHRRQGSIVDLPDILVKKEGKFLLIQSLIL